MYEQSLREVFCLEAAETAQDSSDRPPDHFLMVQYPSAQQHTSLAVYAASGALSCVPAAKFTVNHASRFLGNDAYLSCSDPFDVGRDGCNPPLHPHIFIDCFIFSLSSRVFCGAQFQSGSFSLVNVAWGRRQDFV